MSSKILIVEDEIIIAIDLKIRLEDLGYYVPGIAINGRDAIKKTGEKNPDIILMDILLNGDKDGIEVAQQIRNQYNIPIIYLTGSQNDSMIERAEITEPYGYINKPFDNTEIETAIKLAISKTNNSG
ncbi:MAG: response regulator [Methanobacterium sp.]|uniref:response regulator n=1 Tax=Methanobacterium sp. TaxID=2164 RepID=UPI003C77F888